MSLADQPHGLWFERSYPRATHLVTTPPSGIDPWEGWSVRVPRSVVVGEPQEVTRLVPGRGCLVDAHDGSLANDRHRLWGPDEGG